MLHALGVVGREVLWLRAVQVRREVLWLRVDVGRVRNVGVMKVAIFMRCHRW